MKATVSCPPGVNRRTFARAAIAAVAVGKVAPAQRPARQPRVKGPLVWLDMDQKGLDDAYDQSVYAPNQQQVTGRWATNSEAVRQRLGPPSTPRADAGRGA